jgi:solute carrier family 9 (sodium/hydrogen exchanger), member 8
MSAPRTVVVSETTTPTFTPTVVSAELVHEYDALAALSMNVILIICLLAAYYVKQYRLYHLPESSISLTVGVIVGGIVRIVYATTPDHIQLWEFSPEVFFFVLLPPIIFEAGYSLNRRDFFDNIGAITLFTTFGTVISTFVVGLLVWYVGYIGLVSSVDGTNPMEALLFGALISAVDPVATLSIMGNADLRCDPLLYSLIFGESVLNDAVAISLYKVFADYYNDPQLSTNPDAKNEHSWNNANIPSALLSFVNVSIWSIVIGVLLGLLVSAVYKHTHLSSYPNLETALLFSFCYLCYATGEAFHLSGILALFFQGMVLSHYNSYNLSSTAHVASEQIFATLATLAETVVFLFMGMGVFTGRFSNYDPLFSVLALLFCLIGRAVNIFPLSCIANLCRSRSSGMSTSGSSNYLSNGSDRSVVVSSKGRKISFKMQCVMWFAGLRGAIAFALAMNMPGPNREAYATATLSICIFTTVVCGGLTDHMLTLFGMKQARPTTDDDDNGMQMRRVTFTPQALIAARTSPKRAGLARRASQKVYKGVKRLWKQIDEEVLKEYFGGSSRIQSLTSSDERGNYELSNLVDNDGSESDDEDGTFINGNRR